ARHQVQHRRNLAGQSRTSQPRVVPKMVCDLPYGRTSVKDTRLTCGALILDRILADRRIVAGIDILGIWLSPVLLGLSGAFLLRPTPIGTWRIITITTRGRF